MKLLLALVMTLGLVACVSTTSNPSTNPIVKPQPAICQLPAETGLCRAAHQRYFFNTQTNRCEIFTYGGCRGNANNFMSQQQCQTTCQ